MSSTMENLVKAVAREPRSRNRAEQPVPELSDFGKFLMDLNYWAIGARVERTECFGEEILSDVTAICRRRFKKDEILILDLLDEDAESGIAFTEERMFYWTDEGGEVEAVPYADIRKVDFAGDEVLVEYGDSSVTMNLGDDAEDEKYTRYMYNFIMDIVDYVQAAAKTGEENCDE